MGRLVKGTARGARRAVAATVAVYLGLVGAPRLAVGDSIRGLSMEELLELEVTVATTSDTDQRETSGVVTVITGEELELLGARDLIDVLQLVPGYFFGVDVQGTVGLGARGNWGAEGKILLLIDGHEYNEDLFTTNQFGNHFPVTLIDKIELIRGPGSVMYGGYAELGVIKITTRGAAGYEGVRVTGTYGQMPGTSADEIFGDAADRYARRTLSALYGTTLTDGLRVHGSLFVGQGQRSDRAFTDIGGTRVPMLGNSALDPFTVNLGADYKGLSALLTVDWYRTTNRDAFDAVFAGPEPQHVSFRSYFARLSYRRELAEGMALTPYLKLEYQQPYRSTGDVPPTDELWYDASVARQKLGASLDYDASERLHFLVGAEGYLERAANAPETPVDARFQDGKRVVTYSNGAAFAHARVDTPFAKVTAGGRAELHSRDGLSLLPRVALTRRVGRFHAKALYARAFRAPGVENVALAPDIDPERTNTVELEAGYMLAESLHAAVNVYDITIDNPIVFTFDVDSGVERYFNFERTGSRGLELQLRYKGRHGFATLGYSFYSAAGKNEVPEYAVAGRDDVLVAIPQHKATVHGSWTVTERLSLSPSAVVFGKRYAYTTLDAVDESVLATLDPTVLLNFNAQLRDLGTRGLTLNLAVYDLLGQDYDFVQPYNGYHAPLPGPSRELMLRLVYER